MAEIYNPWDTEMYPQPLELAVSTDSDDSEEPSEESPGAGHSDMMMEALDVIDQQASVIKQLMEMLAPSSEAE